MDSVRYVHASRISFADTDCSGWMHFPKIFRHIEEAEHAYLRQQGLVIISREAGGWPRVHIECDYKQPLLFDEEIEVHLGIEKMGAASVSWLFEVLRDGAVTAYGKMTTVRVNALGKPEPMDEETRRRLLPPDGMIP